MHSIRSGYRVGYWKWWTHWISPSTYIDWVKYYYQRATRGWADCDTWSLDNYLADWLPDALRHLKKHKHGIPAEMFQDGELETVQPDGSQWAGEEGNNRASAKWDATMDRMIAGFEAYQRMTDGLYEKELGPYPLEPGDFFDNLNKPWSEEKRSRFDRSEELRKADMVTFEEGAALFVKHFYSLWD